MKNSITAFAVLLVLAVLVQGAGAAPAAAPAKVDGRGGFTLLGGDSTRYDADFLIHAVQLDPETGAAAGTIYLRVWPHDAPADAICWRVDVTHLFVGGWSGGFGVAGVIAKTNAPAGGTGEAGHALALTGSAAAESGDSVDYYVSPYHEAAVGAARGGALGSASLTWGDITVR